MDQVSQVNSTPGAFRALPTGGKVAVLLCALTAVLLIWQAAAAGLEVLRLPSLTAVANSDRADGGAAYQQAQERRTEMIDGRSLFVKPPRPRRERLPVMPVAVEEESEEEAPTSYGGPKIIAMVGEQVWFDDDTRLRVGEVSGSLEVVAVRAPWTARLRWRGEEFTERLFDRDKSAIPLLPFEEEASDDSPQGASGDGTTAAEESADAAQSATPDEE
jgi:hypothetical protein